ncbi:MAG: hydantoinase B/oxoprolinase family protein [Nitrososphaerales archaeon]
MQQGAEQREDLDPIAVEIISNYLTAISNEMSADLQRASYNMMIYEVRDYCTALLNEKGELLSQNVGGVSHFVADLGVVIRDGVARYGLDGLSPGDVLITNHQKVAGQHLNNIVIYTPIFVGEKLKAFACVRAHWVDVGGMSTGFGGTGRVTDPWMEGLQIDQLKLYEKGRVNEVLMKMIRDNIRFPEASLGDLRAQISACKLAETRVMELYERYSEKVISQSLATIFRQTEQKCRQVVSAIKDGEYTAESLIDDDTYEAGKPVVIKVKVTVKGDDMTIDFTGTNQQVKGGINSRTHAAAVIAYKALTDPLGPVNEGSIRGLSVIIPEGTIMMAKYPAPMSGWSIILPTAVDTIMKALAPALPDKVPAAHYGELGLPIVFFGTDKKGKRFVVQSIEGGGWGGRPFEDGPSASVSVCQGDVRNGPIESIELRCPVVIEKRALRSDSGGAGKYRGGLGIETRVRNLVEGMWNLRQSRRRKFPPWGLEGGASGEPAIILVKKPGEEEWKQIDAIHYPVPENTLVTLRSAGGGGWGNPLDRDLERVRDDCIRGLVSPEKARSEYGVMLDSTNTIDTTATIELRAKLRASPSA